jgi:dienelactone hydrolase
VATVVLFHSVLGVRPGIEQAAELLRSNGHEVQVVDQNDGEVFDDYEPAMAYMREAGSEALMQKALDLTAGIPDGFVPAGFSNGAGMAQYVAGKRRNVGGILMFGGAMDPAWLETDWPAGVPGQIHQTLDDPWRDEGTEAAVAAGRAAGAEVELFDYPGSGHLFADRSKEDEYQPAEAELMWSRVLDFLKRVG